MAMGRPRACFRTLARTHPDPYVVLGVARDARPEHVKLAYYQLAMQHHPDRSSAAGAGRRFADIGAAYAVLAASPSHEPDAAGRSWSAAPAGSVASTPASFAPAFPHWVYRLSESLQRVPRRLDAWLTPSHASSIYEHVRMGDLAAALQVLDLMLQTGERPTNAVYEMLVRGCAIAMRRPAPGVAPDHLTCNLMHTVLELWGGMEAVGCKPDYLTHIELIRAFGKAGAVPQALQLFYSMCSKVSLMPEERVFNSVYEACIMAGCYRDALNVFDEHEEMRKSLWKPRFTPVTFSLLLTATAEVGEGAAARLQYLPRVLGQMRLHGVLPRAATCARLVGACLAEGEVGMAQQVVELAESADHQLSQELLTQFRRARLGVERGRGRRARLPTV